MERRSDLSLYDELSERILSSEKFSLYQRLVKNEILKTLKLDGIIIDELNDEQIEFLLKCASILACSSYEKNKQLAYSISILIHTQFSHNYPEISNITSILLIRLGNFPAYQLVQRMQATNSEESLPLTLQLEAASKSIDNMIRVSSMDLYLTDFQKELYESLQVNPDFSFSAPTSAGKSFLLILYIIDQLKRSSKINVVYIVPTKALINQVKNDLKHNLATYGVVDVRILSSTVSFEFEGLYEEIKQDKHILILTQERLSYLLARKELEIPIDILIVDEAQKINDGNRGILLERVILQTIAQHPSCKIVFSSPLASNPGFFKKYKSSVHDLKTNSSPVHQNLLFISSKKKKPFVSWLDSSLITIVDSFPLQNTCPKTDKAKMAFIAYHLGKGQSNILYANGPSDTEELAKELCTYLPDVEHKKIDQFVDFIKEHIHIDYTLIECLKKGVVFHYSTMPRELKEEIENLFKDETVPINYLCCTSTLLEGMNLPARNVFIHKPTKGSGNKMNEFDFWNLSGRAGRLLKDFYGNIYCIDVDDWGSDSYKPEKSVENYIIKSAIEESVENPQTLSNYLEDIRSTISMKQREVLEQTTSTFFLNYLNDESNTIESFAQLRGLSSINNTDIQRIGALIIDIAKRNQLPKTIIERNSSIDPRLQNNLYDYFRTIIYTTLLPKFPASKEFYESVQVIFGTIDRIFFAEGDKKILGKYVYLSNQWVNEASLGQLINAQIDYEEREHKFKSVNKCVRELVDIIERTITYKYAKYLKCYNDILEYHLKQINAEEKIINLSAYLELGAHKPTTLSLISFGLSRTTAIRLKNIIRNDNFDRAECRAWLDRYYEVSKANLPAVCQEDFENNFE